MRDIKFKLLYDNDNDSVIVRLSDMDSLDKDKGEHLYSEAKEFIGLHDKNNREIYEDDILDYRGYISRVKFERGCFVGIPNKQKAWDKAHIRLGGYNQAHIKVIGNMHENPELFEKE